MSGVLCDISGVLAESSATGDGVAIPGSAEAVARLRAADVRIKFVTNESARTRASLLGKLTRLGFELELEDLLTPAMAMMVLVSEQKLRPHLLVHPNVMEDFAEADTADPNCVVIGDCAEHFTFEKLNEAFQVGADAENIFVIQKMFLFIQVLLKSSTTPLYTLGKGKFYKEDDHLQLDVGPFAAALEFASERKAVVSACGTFNDDTSAANRSIGEVVQSRRRPLLGPSPG